MCLHETKACQRCNTSFECKPGSITQCQCFEVILTAEQRAYLEQRYNDCLCKKCLIQLKEEFELFKEKFIFR
jgi:Cysteine-rich CWC